jgi:hypothetical protein
MRILLGILVIFGAAVWTTKHFGWPELDLLMAVLALLFWGVLSIHEQIESLEKKIGDLETRLDRATRG